MEQLVSHRPRQCFTRGPLQYQLFLICMRASYGHLNYPPPSALELPCARRWIDRKPNEGPCPASFMPLSRARKRKPVTHDCALRPMSGHCKRASGAPSAVAPANVYTESFVQGPRALCWVRYMDVCQYYRPNNQARHMPGPAAVANKQQAACRCPWTSPNV